MTIHLSGKLAKYIADHNPYPSLNALKAKALIIDGVRYDSVNEYAEKQKRAEERERHEREDRKRKAAERERIALEIRDLTEEKNSLKGMFSGIKRKKIQEQIDALNRQLQIL